ncbi:Cytochrome c oxidase assembly protein COX19 [Lachnellula suecica]|uniref:Cytochrome c oxidase assembly protein COX19 n=1 Tax=Lachnellula suecica TaxID=602035 RepID=A0A8T9CDY0_9HELO|nr:Cytochrome c oxidase assembly protein COX19 [Lachnellula suecica]
MSTFGSPGGRQINSKPTPPERGSFPLDHDGMESLGDRATLRLSWRECKNVMMSYLSCIKKVKGTNEAECRDIAKSYLSCRMDRWVAHLYTSSTLMLTASRNLMAKDEFKNLGFGEDKPMIAATKANGAEEVKKNKPGELRW